MLGGSSSLNFLMMVFPGKSSIDAWEALGNDGWNYDALAPYYRKFAKTYPPSPNAMEFCRLDGQYSPEISASETGPLAVTYGDGFGPNNAAWFDGLQNLGLKMAADPRSGTPGAGAFQQPATIDPASKTRTSSASAYLTPEVRARENLTVLIDTLVKKIVFEPGVDESDVDFVAKGVEIRSRDGHEQLISAKEVILSAGALHTPQILELSGIGGRAILKKHGVPVLIVRAFHPSTAAGLSEQAQYSSSRY